VKKSNNTAVAVLVIVIIAIGYLGYTGKISLSSIGVAAPGPTSNPGCAFIAGQSSFNSPPNGCGIAAQILQITPQQWNPGINSETGTYEKTTGVGCKIFTQVNGVWGPTEFDQSSSAGVCTTGTAYNVGTPMVVQFCEDDSTGCTSSDFSATQTVMYCPLPSIAGSGLCGNGVGAGYVPFSSVTSASTAPTSYFYMPIQVLMGDDPDGANSATASLLTWTYQNGTAITSAHTCFLSATGSTQCGGGTSAAQRRFSLQVQLANTGTFPTSPYSIGYAPFTPIDPSLQQGPTARGTLQYVLTVEVKATTGTDMCVIQNGGAITGTSSITPTIISKGGSATDQLYIYTIPASSITRSTDASGNVISTGIVNELFNMDCSQVTTASDVVTVTGIEYAYYSVGFVTAYAGNTLNPEAVTTGPTAFALSIDK
jgi:hypothetical protein